MIETFTQRMIREAADCERLTGRPMTAFDFDQAFRINAANALADRCRGGAFSIAGETAFDNALDDATHMTDATRERVLE